MTAQTRVSWGRGRKGQAAAERDQLGYVGRYALGPKVDFAKVAVHQEHQQTSAQHGERFDCLGVRSTQRMHSLLAACRVVADSSASVSAHSQPQPASSRLSSLRQALVPASEGTDALRCLRLQQKTQAIGSVWYATASAGGRLTGRAVIAVGDC
jgi:hypothetical protein